jgi:hypothetical protein
MVVRRTVMPRIAGIGGIGGLPFRRALNASKADVAPAAVLLPYPPVFATL